MDKNGEIFKRNVLQQDLTSWKMVVVGHTATHIDDFEPSSTSDKYKKSWWLARLPPMAITFSH